MKTLIDPLNNLEKLSAELKALRKQKKLTQNELAQRCMLSRRTITNAESAHNTGLDEFIRMANALGYELALRPRRTVVFEELGDVFPEEE